MDKKTQDLAWACLPKEARESIRNGYKINVNEYNRLSKSAVWNEASACYSKFKLLEDFFGKHNLTSDTEPEEMLIVERKKVQNICKDASIDIKQSILYELFGDKCLPDKAEKIADKCIKPVREHFEKEQPSVQVEPKFKVGDFALVTGGYANGSVITIKAINVETPISYRSDLRDDGMAQWFLETQLEPYTKLKPKFKIGDKVYQTVGHNRLDEYTIKKVYTDKNRGIVYDIQGLIGIMGIEENKLCLTCQNPYTKSETKDNMLTEFTEDPDLAQKVPYFEHLSKTNRCEKCEVNAQQCTDSPCQNYPLEEKELNLCELLKGCVGEKFFSISAGEVTFKAIYDYDDTHKVRVIRKDAVGNEYNVNFHSDGRRNKSGLPDLYPSEDLLKKYPLDAYSAWIEWKEARKPKRWTPKDGVKYWFINTFFNCDSTIYDEEDSEDRERIISENCFTTQDSCERAAEAVRECFKKFLREEY